MRTLVLSLIASLLVAACSNKKDFKAEPFSIEVMNKYTPVKDQGHSQSCWIYAMLATIETEHLMRGDSVNLSAAWLEQKMGTDPRAPRSGRGTCLTTVHLLQKHGVVAYDAMRTVDVPAPRRVFMFGVELTPLEFAHSVCLADEYVGLCSTTDVPYGETTVPDWPDNWDHSSYLNVERDSLVAIAERAVRTGHGVCWEGDTSERGYSFERGVARLSLLNGRTTDDHAMAIVGIARDKKAQKFFVLKNSWGTDNPYGGLVYMSFDYFREKTVALAVPRKVFGG